MGNIKNALEYALHAFEHLHNTQTYQGDNQDFSDEIITMRQALAELEQAKQEPAQAVEQAQSGWLMAIDEALVCHDVGVANADDDYEQAKDKLNKLLCVVQDIGAYFAKQEPAQAVPYGWHITGLSCLMVGEYAEHDAKAAAKRCGGTTKAIPLYTVPPAIDDETRKMVLEEFPLLDDDGLSETEHPAEWAIQQDRKRLHKILNRLEPSNE